jgi:hypothetical protein
VACVAANGLLPAVGIHSGEKKERPLSLVRRTLAGGYISLCTVDFGLEQANRLATIWQYLRRDIDQALPIAHTSG